MARFITNLLLIAIIIELIFTTNARVVSPWQSISKRLPSLTEEDQCLVCLNDHCNLPSPQEVSLPLYGTSYVSFCCTQGLGGWCNSSLSMKSVTDSSYLYYIWNVTNSAETCPPLIDVSSHIDCVPRNFSSPPTMINDIIAVPQGSCYGAALLCLRKT